MCVWGGGGGGGGGKGREGGGGDGHSDGASAIAATSCKVSEVLLRVSDCKGSVDKMNRQDGTSTLASHFTSHTCCHDKITWQCNSSHSLCALHTGTSMTRIEMLFACGMIVRQRAHRMHTIFNLTLFTKSCNVLELGRVMKPPAFMIL